MQMKTVKMKVFSHILFFFRKVEEDLEGLPIVFGILGANLIKKIY